jgi:hypothetical protein
VFIAAVFPRSKGFLPRHEARPSPP